MKRYQKALWHHDHLDEPVVLNSEVDSGFEMRKVEVYRDVRHDYTDGSRSTGTTALGEKLMPSVERSTRSRSSRQKRSARRSSSRRGGAQRVVAQANHCLGDRMTPWPGTVPL